MGNFPSIAVLEIIWSTLLLMEGETTTIYRKAWPLIRLRIVSEYIQINTIMIVFSSSKLIITEVQVNTQSNYSACV